MLGRPQSDCLSQHEYNEPKVNTQHIILSDLEELGRRVRRYLDELPDLPETWAGLSRSWAPPLDCHHDLNRILRVFDLITMEPGYELDYLYVSTRIGGQPFPYARHRSEPRISSRQEYKKRFGLVIPQLLLGQEPTPQDSTPYLDHLSFDPTPLGLVQFALFNLLVRRFYLCWHAHYNTRHFVVDASDADLIRLPSDPFVDPGDSAGESLLPILRATITRSQMAALRVYDLLPHLSAADDRTAVRFFCHKHNAGYAYCRGS